MARRFPKRITTPNGVGASSEKNVPALSKMTYSTRFDDRQRELIDQAAKLKQWSPAKLIREAAISRAADIVNASGSSSPTLRHLARLVAKQLVKPTCIVINEPDGTTSEVPEIDLDLVRDHPGEYWSQAMIARANRPSQEDQDQIQAALLTCGESFIQMILEAWQALDTGGDVYKPKVVLGDLCDETEAREEASPLDT